MVLLLVAGRCSLRARSVVLAMFPWLKRFDVCRAKLYLRLIHGSSRGLSFLGVISSSLLGCYSGRFEGTELRFLIGPVMYHGRDRGYESIVPALGEVWFRFRFWPEIFE